MGALNSRSAPGTVPVADLAAAEHDRHRRASLRAFGSLIDAGKPVDLLREEARSTFNAYTSLIDLVHGPANDGTPT